MPATTEPSSQPVPPKPEPPVETIKPVLASYVSSAGVLLRLDSSNRDWRRLAVSTEQTQEGGDVRVTRAEVRESERLLCLPSYRAALQVSTGATVEMVGETELMFLPPEEGTDVHIRLDRGQLVLGTNQATAAFQIDFLDQSWRITLRAPEVLVGLELMPVWKPGAPYLYEGMVVVPGGEVEFLSASQSIQLGGPVQMRWSSASGLSEKEALGVVPAWIDGEDRTTVETRASIALEKELGIDSPVALALVDATTNERKESRLLGVQCLGAIGRLPALIEVMNTRDRREMRHAAIAAARRHIARGQAQEDALWQALLVRFKKSREHAQGVIDLLRGYSDSEFQQLQKNHYEDLIKLLSPERELLIRELAIMNLEDLAGRPLNTNYNPDTPKDSDIAAWQRAASDGRLPPKVRGKM
jgi:hypothetical protein